MKESFRKDVLQKLSKYTFDTSLSIKLEDNLNLLINQLSAKIIDRKPNIFTYMAIGYEFSTDNLIRALFKTTNIHVPRCKDNEYMEVVPINSFDDLEIASYGIREPKQEILQKQDSNIDFAVIPGVSFDKSFNRLGRGKGYYDRYLASLNYTLVKIGVCWDCQLFDNIPVSDNDQKMDYIVTPSVVLSSLNQGASEYCFMEGGC